MEKEEHANCFKCYFFKMIKSFVGLKKYIFTDLVKCFHGHDKLAEVGRTFWTIPFKSLLMLGHAQLIAQEHVQTAFEYI